ncbi:MAG: YgjV family protein [Clostridia bacterium]|nr:YgjV family protein [Clostridia bacterium]
MPFDLSTIDWGFVGIQLIGFVAMGLGIGSFQAKRRTTILTIQISASVLWCLQFFLLNSPAGLINNVLGIARNTVYSQKERWVWVRSIFVPIGFMAAFVAAGIYTYTLEGLISLLPTVAMIIQTAAYYITNEKILRICSLFVSPLWLIYDAIQLSAAGVLCESFTIISIIIALIRYREKREKTV